MAAHVRPFSTREWRRLYLLRAYATICNVFKQKIRPRLTYNIELGVKALACVSGVPRSILHASFFSNLTIVVLRPNSVRGS